jgi:shikimate kinase
MPAPIIFLVGFMGAGKSTWGKKIAARLGYQHRDLDTEIEKSTSKSIPEIMAQDGEDTFRLIERDTLRAQTMEALVLSTGGGTACYHSNMDWMKAHGQVIYIAVNEGVLYQRLSQPDAAKRPLIKGLSGEGLQSFIHLKLLERQPYYMQADITWNPVQEHISHLIEQLK